MKSLPCPFCGAEPVVLPGNPNIEGDAWAAVQCQNAKCPTFDSYHGVTVLDGEQVADSRGSDGYKAVAIRRWNIRHT